MSYGPARVCVMGSCIVAMNALTPPISGFGAQKLKTVTTVTELLGKTTSWESLPQQDIEKGKEILEGHSWLWNETEILFLASLDRAGTWTQARHDDKIKGIAILRKPETERTEEDNIFIAHLDKNETVTN